jgi:hypothetical protein
MSFFKSIKISEPLTAFGDLRTAELSPVFQGSFEYTVDNTELNKNLVANGGTVTQANAMAVIGTSTTTASTARLHSKKRAKYRAGLGGLFRFTAKFTTPVAATIQYIGMADGHGSGAEFINGLTVGYNGTTFGFQRWQNDVLFEVAQSAWDDPLDGTGASGMTLDQTKINVFQIRFQYLGAGAMELSIEDDTTGRFVVVHTILYANLNTTPSTYSPNYLLMIHVDNKETVSDIIVSCSSYAYFIEGKTTYTEVHQPLFSSGKQSTGSITTELAIFTIRNKSSYVSKTNYIDLILEAISVSIEASGANNLATIRVVKDATLGGSPSYSDISTTDSIVDIDVDGTLVSSGKELFNFGLAGKNDEIFHGLGEHKIYLSPGETITISAISAGTATVNANLLWKELF